MATVATVTTDVSPPKGNPEDLVYDYGQEDWVPVVVDLSDIVVAEPLQLAVYKRRWFMMFVVTFLSLSNSCMWINFSPVTNATASFFGNIDNGWVDLLSLVFFITTIPFMFVAMWITNKMGFRMGIRLGCALNFSGAFIRIFGTAGFVPSSAHYPLTLIGQVVTALAQSFGLAMPTKVSEVWFPENQRAFSTAACSLGNPVGFLLANLVSPLIVNTGNDIPVMNKIFCSLGMASGLMGLFVWESKPPLPPSNTSRKLDNVRNTTYCADLREIFVNKDFVILMLCIGGGSGLVNSFGTMMGQMMCTFGYSDDVAGLCEVLNVVGGLFGAALFSIAAVKTNQMQEIMIIFGFNISIIMSIILVMIFCIGNIEWAIVTVNVLIGFTSLGMYPIALEVAAECTYPVDESLSNGILVLSSQLLSAIFIAVMAALGQPPSDYDLAHEVCSVDGTTVSQDFTYPALLSVGVVSILAMIMTMFFRPKYKRREAERLKIDSEVTSHQSQSAVTN